ncbi:MAG: exodeoxyribonuclease V subunit beta [Neisseria sp.]|nr:exodeoxyribonuclease V subunit beta [Neisseria sp.]
MKTFDPFTLPASGTSLIEASAGTGKTFGIAALFTRWVLLEKKSVTRLLVLTFTKAATAELKTRLRARLSQILRLLSAPQLPENQQEIAADAFLQDLFARLADDEEPPERLQWRVRAALDEFDGAGIYTIHGFCRSVLNDEAFLCGVPFTVEQVENQDAVIERLRDDFWRQTIAHHPERAQLCFAARLTPQQALNDIKPYLASPYLHYTIPHDNWAAARDATTDAWQAALPLLRATIAADEANALCDDVSGSLKDTVRAAVETPWRTRLAVHGMSVAEAAFWRIFPRLNQATFRAATFEKLFAALTAAAQENRLPETPSAALEKLSLLQADVLPQKTKKGQQLEDAEIALFAPLANYGTAYAAQETARDDALLAIRFELLRFIDHGLNAEKRRSNRRSFNDLLLDVHHAVTAAPYRARLTQRLAASWDALMVDEFQDTDPIQYAIFKTAFAARGVPLYLVGDPKQAIYRFRGADIFTYLQAAQDAGEQRYTLDTNWRSHHDLVSGIAALFARDLPFVHEHIDYPPLRAARERSQLQPSLQALTVFRLNTTQEETSADELRERAANACADHMAQVLNRAATGSLKLGERSFGAGDIAVLVHSHSQARKMMSTLKKRGIVGVSMQRESVFSSDEAQALAALLRFWLNPQQTDLLRFVLAGVLFQYTATQLDALNRDDAAMARHVEMARRALTRWQEAGIFAAYQYFNRETALEQSLIRRRAERSLTNVFQLLELLAAAAADCFGERALATWLEKEIQAASEQRSDHALLRLENDEALVKIITIHAAKGLQYPLVYCPFAYAPRNNQKKPIEKIRRDDHTDLLGKSQWQEDDLDTLNDEQLSEELRLLYVALTRAGEALVLCSADNDYGGKSKHPAHKLPLDYLLHPYGGGSTWQAWQNWAQHTAVNAVELSEILPDACAYAPPSAPRITFQAASAPQRGFDARRLTSFSAWARLVEEAADTAQEEIFSVDHAEQSDDMLTANDGDHLHTFPGGTQAGLCWHEILEHFDFARPAAEQAELISRKLDAYGFDGAYWGEKLFAVFDHTRLAPLNPHITLAALPRRRRLAENGFLLNRLRFDPHTVDRIIGNALPAVVRDALQQVSAHTVSGFFNGFIDMTAQDDDGKIYLIDYKSNRLGSDSDAYTPDALNAAMAQHQYAAQAVIYALATRRYLAARGITPPLFCVRYLFLRGVQADGARGIWSWDIDPAQLAMLDAALAWD